MRCEIKKQLDSETRLLNQVNRYETEFQQVFLRVIANIRDELTLDTIATSLEQGNLEQALVTAYQQTALFADSFIAAVVASGVDTAEELTQELGIFVSFDRTNVRLIQALQDARLGFINGLTQQQIESVRTSLVIGSARGLNPVDQARLIHDNIGLTAYQTQAVNNFRTALETGDRRALNRQLRDRRFDPSVERSLLTGESLTPQQIDRMVNRYEQRMLRYRSEQIAQTQALRAANEGQNSMFQQAVDAAILSPSDLERTWITAGDEVVRGSHQFMNGQVRAFGEEFETGNGNLLEYPGDPNGAPEEVINCRCTLATRIRRNNNG